jgi:hypothetical protein
MSLPGSHYTDIQGHVKDNYTLHTTHQVQHTNARNRCGGSAHALCCHASTASYVAASLAATVRAYQPGVCKRQGTDARIEGNDMCRTSVSKYSAIFAANYSVSRRLPQCQKCL